MNKNNILFYVTKLLSESDYSIRFHSKQEEENFINYIWKCYEEFQTEHDNPLYKEKYLPYFDFDKDQLNWCLFIDATEYRPSVTRIHWLVRIGNGDNFKHSSAFHIWGLKQTNNTKYFEKTVKKGDILWFILSKNNGQAIAFAEYVSHNERTKTNEELGWKVEKNSDNWTTEINYTNLTNVEEKHYFTHIIGQNVNIRKYNDKCKINLPLVF